MVNYLIDFGLNQFGHHDLIYPRVWWPLDKLNVGFLSLQKTFIVRFLALQSLEVEYLRIKKNSEFFPDHHFFSLHSCLPRTKITSDNLPGNLCKKSLLLFNFDALADFRYWSVLLVNKSFWIKLLLIQVCFCFYLIHCWCPFWPPGWGIVCVEFL